MGIKEIVVILIVLGLGYYLGTNDAFARFLPGG